VPVDTAGPAVVAVLPREGELVIRVGAGRVAVAGWQWDRWIAGNGAVRTVPVGACGGGWGGSGSLGGEKKKNKPKNDASLTLSHKKKKKNAIAVAVALSPTGEPSSRTSLDFPHAPVAVAVSHP
jgi:hypothetical protein